MYKDIDLNFVEEYFKKEPAALSIPKLYKGISSGNVIGDILLTDPKTNLRPSKTAKEHGNIYNLILNNQEKWKDLPLRQHSVIMTGKREIASSFAFNGGNSHGKIFLVFPDYDSRLVVCPENDIWYSFTKGLSLIGLRGKNNDLTYFNRFLSEIFTAFEIVNPDLSYKNFIENIDNIRENELKLKKRLSSEAEIILNKIMKSAIDAENLIEQVFDPEINDFAILNYNTELSLDKDKSEIWTDANCILVEEKIFTEFFS